MHVRILYPMVNADHTLHPLVDVNLKSNLLDLYDSLVPSNGQYKIFPHDRFSILRSNYQRSRLGVFIAIFFFHVWPHRTSVHLCLRPAHPRLCMRVIRGGAA